MDKLWPCAVLLSLLMRQVAIVSSWYWLNQSSEVELDGVSRVWHQSGGGQRAVGELRVDQLSDCEVEYGAVNGLSSGAPLRIERVLGEDEMEDDLEFRVVARVPMGLCAMVCHQEHLKTICKQHGVKHSCGTLAGIQEVTRGHRCGVDCSSPRLLLARPERVEWCKKNVFAFRYLTGSPSSFRYKKDGAASLQQFGDPAGLSTMKYAFAEPVVAISSGPLVVEPGVSVDASRKVRFPPRPLAISEKMKIVRNWVQASSAYALSEGPCAVCARNMPLTNLSSVSLEDDCFLQLFQYTPEVTRPSDGDSDMLDRVLLPEAVHFAKLQADVCKQCLASLRKNRMPPLAMANGLWLGRVPAELRALNFVEKMLVARYRHNMCVVTVSGGAREMRANALVCAQPVAEFYRVLPPTPVDLAGMLAIFCTGPCKLSEEDMKRAPVYVRREVVLRALEWLKAHHSDYGDLVISRENLSMYGDDRPAVDWFFHPSDGKEPLESLAVYEGGIEVDAGEGMCPFVVYGLCADDVVKMNYENRMSVAIEHLRKGGRVLGYGQSAKPESIYHNPRMYPGMFPWLFPYGLGGFENELMIVGVPRKTHQKYLLAYFDRRFQTDGYFIYLVYNQEQIRASSKGAYVLVERRNFENVAEKILSVNEDALRELVERTREEGYTAPRNEEERRCFELLSLIDHVGGHVPGSNTRKKWQRSEIKSLIIRYGMPVFFITFAPSGSSSPICLYLCGEKVDLNSYVPLDIARQQRVDAAVKNPVACARFFDLMVRLFTEHVLRADTDQEGLFGCTSAYYGTVEEQLRKALHMHMLLWIAGSLSPEEIRERITQAEEMFVQEIVEWLDSCVQGQCSTGSVREVTGNLMRKGLHVQGAEGQADAWDDPRVCLPALPPHDGADSGDMERWFAQVCAITDEIVTLVNVHDKRHPHGCQKPPDFQCRARFPRPLVPVTLADAETGVITLKKGEAWVNTFNVVLTYLMRCNTDVTCLLSGTSVRAVIAYVTDYITKRSLKMGTMMEIILAVYNGKAKLTSSCTTRSQVARRLVTKIVNAFTSRLQVGGPAVCAELLGHPDHYTNKYFKVLYWRSYVRFVGSVFATDDDNDPSRMIESWHDPEPRDLLVLGRSGGRILGYSRLDDYVYRPEEFGQLCLYDFLRLTDVVPSRGMVDVQGNATEHVDGVYDDDSDAGDSDSESEDEHRAVKLPGRKVSYFQFKRGHAKRDTHAVVRVNHPGGYVINFAGGLLPRRDVGDRELYCKTMLVLFCPGGWRDGHDLREESEHWEDAFDRTDFAGEHVEIMRNMNLLYECQDARDDYAAQRRAAAQLDPLVAFLSDGELNELNVEHDDPLTGVGDLELGALSSSYESQFEEGPVSASHRVQMDVMREFVEDQYGSDVRDDLPAFRSSETDMLDGVATRSSKQWKHLLQEQRSKMLQRVGRSGGADVVDELGSHTGSFESNSRKYGDGVEVLDERAFLEKTGYIPSDACDGVDGNGVDAVPSAGECSSQGLGRTRIEVVRDLYSLNREQYRAFKIVANHLDKREETPLRMLLGGMGGTGKSRVIDALSYFLESRGESHRMIILAPTGAAASLLGGSTYHSVLGLGRGSGSITGYSLGRVRDRLRGVDLVVLDEISMVSCHDMYTISERMSLAYDLPTEAFGGRSLLVGGDFAQLPPAGQWSQPLYSASVGSVSSRMSVDGQKSALGKAVWHGFTTVVILRENMRQRGSTPRARAYREGLERMRYGACEMKDVSLLDSRILKHGKTLCSDGMERFRFVPVIVPLNTHRDALNEACSWRFARAHGQELYDFYSIDRITSSRVGETVSSIVRSSREDARAGFGGLTGWFREVLWNLPPGATEHVAGKLSLCVGMPVMVKYNEATELGVTNGAEAVVHGWASRPLSDGRRALTTLFVRLVRPPRPVRLDGLPENVVPIVASSEKVKCRLPNDKSVTVMREQVPVLPYFAMTDFNAQGRTRMVNVVDLRLCRGAQSVYTCLSRSSSLEDTLILYPWSHKKVMSGIRPDLLRELRELEILADITKQREEGVLPEGVVGSTRSELIVSYQSVFGKWHVPSVVHPALRWDGMDERRLRAPPKPAKWYIVRGAKRGKEPADVDSGRNKRARHVADGPVRPTERFSASSVASASLRSAHVARFGKHRQVRRRYDVCDIYGEAQSRDYGCLPWDRDNWSCGYDCFLRVLQHLRSESPGVWASVFPQNEILRVVDRCFTEAGLGDGVVGTRECIRDLLSALDCHAFKRHGIALASVDQLAGALFATKDPVGQHFKFCTRCGVVNNVPDVCSFFWSTGFNLDMRTRQSTITASELLGNVIKEHGQVPCSACKVKTAAKYASRFFHSPDLFVLEIPAEDARFPQLKVDSCFTLTLGDQQSSAVWNLAAVMYLGHQHFTCRLVSRDGTILFYDGMQHQGSCVFEPTSGTDLASHNGNKACVIIYARHG